MRMSHRWPSALLPLALLAAGTSARSSTAADGTFANPLLPSGPDPWVVADGGVYYYMHTLGNRIALWRTPDIAELAHAEHRTVWTAPKTGLNAHSIWAPELHRLRGKWYLYYSATAEGFRDDQHRGVFVLENAAADPMKGQWVDRGRVNTTLAGIDGTVFDHRGQLYFAYSPYVGAVSGIAIARMSDPWTITGKETVIAEPDKPWEDQGGRRILEGPEFLEGPGGRLYMTYSAGACWSDNCALGMLEAKSEGDLLAAGTWTKRAVPVLKSANGIFATGHNGFFHSPDGREQWVIYHANPGPGMGCTAKRAPNLGKLGWTADGSPIFPEPTSARQARPSDARRR